MKVYSYVLRCDTGFAPNPFWGYCTLAACTPNHMGIRPQIGDWIIGTESIAKGNKLIYAMQIKFIMSFDNYYTDRRFKMKIPVIKSEDWRQHCGDNIYYKNQSGKWKQHSSIFHDKPENKRQDLKHPYVFIAKRFYYFGCKAENIPSKYNSLVWKRQGVKCKHFPKVAEDFLTWLQTNFRRGIHGNPRDCKSKSVKCSTNESMRWKKCAP
jgi:hypothetical protein